MNFETDRIDLCIEFIKELKERHERNYVTSPGELCVMATGGGAFKYYDRMKEALGINVLREDEMECLIIGTCCFLPFPPSIHDVFTTWDDNLTSVY